MDYDYRFDGAIAQVGFRLGVFGNPVLQIQRERRLRRLFSRRSEADGLGYFRDATKSDAVELAVFLSNLQK